MSDNAYRQSHFARSEVFRRGNSAANLHGAGIPGATLDFSGHQDNQAYEQPQAGPSTGYLQQNYETSHTIPSQPGGSRHPVPNHPVGTRRIQDDMPDSDSPPETTAAHAASNTTDSVQPISVSIEEPVDDLRENRKAQRQFRQRRQMYLKDLEERVRRYDANQSDATAEMQATIDRLSQDNQYLRAMVARLQHELGTYRSREHLQYRSLRPDTAPTYSSSDAYHSHALPTAGLPYSHQPSNSPSWNNHGHRDFQPGISSSASGGGGPSPSPASTLAQNSPEIGLNSAYAEPVNSAIAKQPDHDERPITSGMPFTRPVRFPTSFRTVLPQSVRRQREDWGPSTSSRALHQASHEDLPVASPFATPPLDSAGHVSWLTSRTDAQTAAVQPIPLEPSPSFPGSIASQDPMSSQESRIAHTGRSSGNFSSPKRPDAFVSALYDYASRSVSYQPEPEPSPASAIHSAQHHIRGEVYASSNAQAWAANLTSSPYGQGSAESRSYHQTEETQVRIAHEAMSETKPAHIES